MGKTAITISNLSHSYNQSDKKVLDNVNLTVNQGEWLSILGRNGSGKSTLVKLISGLLRNKSDGSIQVFGTEVNEENIEEVRNHLGMVFQNPENQFVGSTVSDDVAFGLENQAFSREKMLKIVNQVLEDVGMLGFYNSQPNNLSGGQKQRVALASVLALEPDIIILDEATSMLDPQARIELIDLVRKVQQKYNLTVVAITHDINETTFSDQIAVINNGQLVENDVPSKIYTKDTELFSYGLEPPLSRQIQVSLEKDEDLHLSNGYLTEEELLNLLCQ